MRRFEVGLTLEGEQALLVQDNLSVQAVSAPGHTRDMLSHLNYMLEKKILFATEAAGSLNKAGQIITEFLVDYDDPAHSDDLLRWTWRCLCQGHRSVFTESDVKGHFEGAIKAAEEQAHLINFRSRVAH